MTQTESNRIAPITSTTEVRREVSRVAELAERGEYTWAAVLERNLWEGVLEAIACCNAQAGWLATEALKSKDIDFPR